MVNERNYHRLPKSALVGGTGGQWINYTSCFQTLVVSEDPLTLRHCGNAHYVCWFTAVPFITNGTPTHLPNTTELNHTAISGNALLCNVVPYIHQTWYMSEFWSIVVLWQSYQCTIHYWLFLASKFKGQTVHYGYKIFGLANIHIN